MFIIVKDNNFWRFDQIKSQNRECCAQFLQLRQKNANFAPKFSSKRSSEPFAVSGVVALRSAVAVGEPQNSHNVPYGEGVTGFDSR
ncbi:MAG: hypothetical protein IJE21_07020 [Alistipes sp.]|nr:hypothetical protein [Alistipes sp.]